MLRALLSFELVPHPPPSPRYSQEYDDASPAPTLVYKALAVPGGAAFAWLVVPSSTRGPCTDTAEVLSRTASSVVVKVSIAGAEHTVTVPVAA